MTMDRENFVKLIQNAGKLISEHADVIVSDYQRLEAITITVNASVYNAIPSVEVNKTYVFPEAIKGVKFYSGDAEKPKVDG